MKTVCGENKCAGCMLCVDICPKQAITIQDDLRAYTAMINEEKCVDCGLCYQKCQESFQPLFREPMVWKEGWAESDVVRAGASSGGIASELARMFVVQGGAVYACRFKQGEFTFEKFTSVDQMTAMAGSKYVKSNPIGVYKAIKSDLKEGEKILFIGLPCQVAALKNWVGDSEDLYTIDLICHGTPSPKILERYLAEHGVKMDQLSEIYFRKKTNFKLTDGYKNIVSPAVMDYYSMTFLDSTIYTENCYSCKYARKERVSDITLGDSWGSQLSTEEQKKGISLILCQTEKGIELMESARIVQKDTDVQRAVEFNRQLQEPSAKSVWREKFFKRLDQNYSFDKIILRCYPKRYVKDVVKRVLYTLKIRGGGMEIIDYRIVVKFIR